MKALVMFLVVVIIGFGLTSWTLVSTMQDLDVTEQSLSALTNRVATMEGENTRLQTELNIAKRGTIIGYALVDTGVIGQLGYDDRTATGLIVELYKLVKELPTGATEWVLIGNTEVDSWGSYKFKVDPGEYYVVPVLAILGYPSWDSAHHLKGGLLSITEGEVVIGPTFLIRQYSPGKG